MLDSIYLYDGLGVSRRVGLASSAVSLLRDSLHTVEEHRPIEDFLRIELQGPGKPLGYFVWVADPRYLTISKWSLFILSLGMLLPAQRVANLPLRPSECPPFDLGPELRSAYNIPTVSHVTLNITAPSTQLRSTQEHWNQHVAQESHRRALPLGDASLDGVSNTVYLRRYYEMLYSTLDGDKFPSGSMIAFKPIGNFAFVVFHRDVHTNALSVNQVGLLDFPLTLLLLIIGLLVPICSALSFSVIVLERTLKRISAFSLSQLQQEIAARALLDMRGNEAHFEAQNERTNLGQDAIDSIDFRTSFFYFLDLQIGNPDVQQSVQVQLLRTIVHILCALLVGTPLLIFVLSLRQAHITYFCAESMEETQCKQSQPTTVLVLNSILWVYLVICVLELYAYYACLRFTYWRKHLKTLFFASITLLCLFSTAYGFILMTWICLGMLVRPAQFLVYAVGFFGAASVWIRRHRNLSRVHVRFRVALKTRCEIFIRRALQHTPYVVVKLLVAREEQKALELRGLSTASVLNSTALLVAGTSVIVIVLIVAFHGLSDVNNIFVGIFNSILVLGVVSLVDRVVNRTDDEGAQKQNLDALVGEVVTTSKTKLAYLQRQLEIGKSLVHQKNLNELAAVAIIQNGFPEDSTHSQLQKEVQNFPLCKLSLPVRHFALPSHRAKNVMTTYQNPTRHLKTGMLMGREAETSVGDEMLIKKASGICFHCTTVLRLEMDSALVGSDQLAGMLSQNMDAKQARFQVEM
mmetsp:Transcript_24229/g.60939  ORF Transcript_24229/g.60939 Transcript_24229/m.60939 type:complete len:748 (+) Transcript_24229:6309-8552(+)